MSSSGQTHAVQQALTAVLPHDRPDSLAEQHFFSLGCVLFPHVTVTWGAGWWEQNMYLAPDAPILSSLVLPDGFDVAKTPLITNLRSDHGFTKPELVSIYESSPHSADTPSSQLFTDYPVQSPSIDEYLARFFAPEHRYHALVFSTAAHFTPREFAFRGGQAAIAPFFQTIARRWVDVAREYLDRDEPTGTREIIVRGASSGHDACHERVGGPLNASETPAQTSYNWGEIPRYNKVFEVCCSLLVPRRSGSAIDVSGGGIFLAGPRREGRPPEAVVPHARAAEPAAPRCGASSLGPSGSEQIFHCEEKCSQRKLTVLAAPSAAF